MVKPDGFAADLHRKPEVLNRLAASFRGELARHGVAAGGAHYIVPIPMGLDAAAVRAAENLQAAGFDVRAIRPPTVPPGTSRLRVAIHADHESALLAQLAEQISAAL